MIVRFGLDLDGNPWPGPLGDRRAVAGEPWVGPNGFLDLLETQLGLTGLRVSGVQRAAGIVPAVTATDGFWSESAKYDPLGVAQELLRWRDEMRLHGWDGTGLAGRLGALAEVTAGASPGIPDRLEAISAALAEQSTGIGRVELLGTAADELPLRWQHVLAALAARGVTIADADIPAATQTGDLLDWRRDDFDPAGDGGIELIRPAGPIAAAEQVAEWLAAQPDLERTVIINGDETLDLALHRVGLPTTGAVTDHGDEPLLQVLPLVMELAWAPADPQLALELLLLPVGPVRRGVARGLAKALHEWPAVGSDDWRAALDKQLGKLDAAAGDRVRERVDRIFHEATTEDEIAVEAVHARIQSLVTWIQGYLQRDDDADADDWSAALTQCTTLRELIDADGRPRLERPELQRLVECATSAPRRRSLRPAQAGLAATRNPAAIFGPAARIVWWGFHRRGASPPRPLPLTPDERVALAAAGAPLPDPGALAVRLARHWRRPLEMAEQQLLLVCPRQSETGDAEHTHPVWDDVAARLSAVQTAKLEHDASVAITRTHPLAALPTPLPRETWTVAPDFVDITVRHSPHSIGKLAGCSLQWVLQRVGNVRSGLVAPLAGGNMLKGRVAHRILELLFKDKPSAFDPAAIAAEAERLFDTHAPRLAALYFQPGHEPLRQEVRKHTVDTAREMARLLRDMNARIDDVEVELKATCDGLSMYGFADLLLQSPRAVIDFKWGSAGRHFDSIRKGLAFQLASYARMVGNGSTLPPVGYFITSRQEMLTTGDLFPGHDPIDGLPVAATWTALRNAVIARLDEIARGEVLAPGVTWENLEKAKSVYADDVLLAAPPCEYCDFRSLCLGEA